MDDRTKEALEGSIRKWQDIVAGTGVDEGSDNCPLCWLFISNECKGCPVSTFTGRSRCHGTPYEDWNAANENDGLAHTAEFKELAQKELDFLISLRDPEVRK
jgi:hypothetical protein